MLAGTLGAYIYPNARQVPVTTNRTLTTQDLNGIMVVDTTLSPVTITLPPANTIRAGGFFWIFAVTGAINPVTVQVQGLDTYNSGVTAAIVLDQNGQLLEVYGTNASNQWSIPLSAGLGLQGAGQHNVGYVDLVNGNDATGAIGTLRPFKTIQAFLDAVPSGDDSTTARNVFVAQISPGDYDEDLTIDISRKRIILTGPGPWSLGQFNGVDWGPSGTPRNIVVTGSTPEIDGIRSGLVITNNLPLTEAWTTHESYLTRPRISGQIDLSGIVGLASVELGLTCEIFGNPLGVSINAGAAIIQSYLYHCRMRGSVTGSNWNFQQAFYSRFQGLINVSGFSLIDTCRIDAGLTTLSVPPVGIIPGGMINTYFAGTFTGPVGSAKMDGFTNYYFKANGALLAGGATKVITDDLVP